MEEVEFEEKLDKGYLHCKIIIEILGAPQQHVADTIALVLKKLKEEEDVDVLSDKIHPVEPREKLFSTFADVDLLFKDFTVLTRISFDYMPSSVEILKPENFKLPALEISNFVNDMLALLHNIDFKLKDLVAGNQLLEAPLRPGVNLLSCSIHEGEQTFLDQHPNGDPRRSKPTGCCHQQRCDDSICRFH